MKLLDTIAAISTPYGKGGVALIRISGDGALGVVNKIFFPMSDRKIVDDAGRMLYGEIRDVDGCVIDDAMAVFFRGPHSFTGEDTVEITCHGGILITAKVLSCALRAGARQAEAGEFTRRAYVNGKMRLSEAEALGNLLEARSEAQITLARNGMSGNLADKTEQIYSSLLSILSSVYAVIDFPDEDLSEMTREEIISGIEDVEKRISDLASTYGTGRAINEGIPTVICGRANAGKSSVYNKILGYEAAIVTDVEGTTRDVLREVATLGKTLLLLSDTAGLRDTSDEVESIGVSRAREEIKNAGLILAVFDISRELDDDDMRLADEIAGTNIPTIVLLNKSDLGTQKDMSYLLSKFEYTVNISALNYEGFDTLAKMVDELFINGEIDVSHDAIVTGARQHAALCRAGEALASAKKDLSALLPLDLCCVAIEEATGLLCEVDGRQVGEEIVSEIFSRFCVGK